MSLTGRIKAMTGYSGSMPYPDLIAKLRASLEGTEPRTFKFIQGSLRSGSDILRKGGDVTMQYTEKTYSIMADNKRVFRDVGVPGVISHSNAFETMDQARLFKTIGEIGKIRYTKASPVSSLTAGKRTDSYTKILLRQFLRALYAPDRAAILGVEVPVNRILFRSYVKTLGFGLSLNYISQQKANKFLANSVPRMDKTEELMVRIKEIFPDLREGMF